MPFSPAPLRQDVRFEPDERTVLPLALGLGTQYAVLSVASVVCWCLPCSSALPAAPATTRTWAVFAALIVSGLVTVVQAVRVWRIGAG